MVADKLPSSGSVAVAVRTTVPPAGTSTVHSGPVFVTAAFGVDSVTRKPDGSSWKTSMCGNAAVESFWTRTV